MSWRKLCCCAIVDGVRIWVVPMLWKNAVEVVTAYVVVVVVVVYVAGFVVGTAVANFLV